MQSAPGRQHAPARQHDYHAEAGDLIRSALRSVRAAEAALQPMRGHLADRAVLEVAALGMQLGRLAAAVEAHSAAMFCRQQADEMDRRAAEAAAPARSVTSRRPAAAGRLLRSVPAVALLAAAGAAVRHALRAHARGTVAASLTAAVTAGTMTSLVLTPHAVTAQGPSVPPAAVAAPAAAAPASRHAAAPRRHRHRHRPAAVFPQPPRTRAPSPPPSATPAAAPGSLLLSSPVMMLAIGATGELNLTASGGDVAWSLSADPGITLSATSGVLRAGLSVTVAVTRTDARTGTVWAEPGGQAVRVTAP